MAEVRPSAIGGSDSAPRESKTETEKTEDESAMHAGTVGERHPSKALPYTYLHTAKMPSNWQNQPYSGAMRGGLERWKRGVESRGVRQAIAYALEGTCDAHLQHFPGVDALEAYSAASDSTVSRFFVANGVITSDELTAGGLRVWINGHDPVSGEGGATSG